MPKYSNYVRFFYFPSFLFILTFIINSSHLRSLNAQPLEDASPPPSITPIPETPFSIPSPSPPPENIPDVGEEIIITNFRFEGNTAFTETQLTEVIQDYLNRPISFSELLQARSAITQYYVEQGYVTSGAYIPPQDIESGIVTIGEMQKKDIPVKLLQCLE